MTDYSVKPPLPVASNAMVFMRQMVLIVAGFTALLGFLSKRDLAGLFVWVQTTEGVTFGATVIALATVAYGQVKNVLWHRRVDAAEQDK